MKRSFSPRRMAVDTLFYLVGGALYALGIYTFARNAQFSPGGLSGIALIINHYTDFPIGLTTLVLNVPLAVVCLRIVGWPFMLKTGWAVLLNTLLMDLVFPHLPAYTGNPLLAAMFAGISLGAGLALVYMRGASTGGMDFVTMSIRKKNPHLSVGQIALCIDLLIILAGGLAFDSVDAVLYGIVASFCTNFTLDNLLYGAGSSKLAIIITNHGQHIAQAIAYEVGRGGTLVPATGAYTGEGREMLLCICSKSEIYRVRIAARSIDPDAMVVITEASEVFGEGFRPPPIPGNEDAPEDKRGGS